MPCSRRFEAMWDESSCLCSQAKAGVSGRLSHPLQSHLVPVPLGLLYCKSLWGPIESNLSSSVRLVCRESCCSWAAYHSRLPADTQESWGHVLSQEPSMRGPLHSQPGPIVRHLTRRALILTLVLPGIQCEVETKKSTSFTSTHCANTLKLRLMDLTAEHNSFRGIPVGAHGPLLRTFSAL